MRGRHSDEAGFVAGGDGKLVCGDPDLACAVEMETADRIGVETVLLPVAPHGTVVDPKHTAVGADPDRAPTVTGDADRVVDERLGNGERV
jgi:hypothetical protein